MEKKKSKPVARPKPMDKVLGANCSALREKRGWTQEDMAERMGVSKSLLSLLESGQKPWNSTSMTKAMDALDISLVELSGGVVLSEEDQRVLALAKALQETRAEIKNLKPSKKR